MGFTNIAQSVSNIQGTIGAVSNAIQSVTSLFGVDVVGIFDSDTYDQLFQSSRPMKANINRMSKIMEHPIETGSIVQDFFIIQPVDIELSMLVTGSDYQDLYQEIKNAFILGTLLSVQTRADVFPNMLIQAMPHEETPDMFDVLPLALKLREIQQVTVQYQALTSTQVAQPADASTVNAGAQQPQQSALYQISNYIGGIFK